MGIPTTNHTRYPEHSERYARWLLALWIVWLPFLVRPFLSLFQERQPISMILLDSLILLVFVSLYITIIWRNPINRPLVNVTSMERWFWPVVLGLATCSIYFTTIHGYLFLVTWIFVSAAGVGQLPLRLAVWTLLAIECCVLVLGVFINAPLAILGQVCLEVAFVGFNTWNVIRTVLSNRQLRVARGEVARLAVNEERLRFARDLHDLLGHDLSLIALKTDVAVHLIAIDPEKAKNAIEESGVVARRALQEVRRAVVGFRQPSLRTELHAASEILSAVGVNVRVNEFEQSIPSIVESVMAWSVRESVTNVVRHSKATWCLIDIHIGADNSCLRIVNDGVTQVEWDDQSSGGSGLVGIRERVQKVGGECSYSFKGGGTFELEVSIPLNTGKTFD